MLKPTASAWRSGAELAVPAHRPAEACHRRRQIAAVHVEDAALDLAALIAVVVQVGQQLAPGQSSSSPRFVQRPRRRKAHARTESLKPRRKAFCTGTSPPRASGASARNAATRTIAFGVARRRHQGTLHFRLREPGPEHVRRDRAPIEIRVAAGHRSRPSTAPRSPAFARATVCARQR